MYIIGLAVLQNNFDFDATQTIFKKTPLSEFCKHFTPNEINQILKNYLQAKVANRYK